MKISGLSCITKKIFLVFLGHPTLYIAKRGDLDRCHACLTDSQSKDRATQLLKKYKSGALVTQSWRRCLQIQEDKLVKPV